MKRLALGLTIVAMSGAAWAQDTTTIKRTETPFGDKTTVTKESDDSSVTSRSTTTTGSVTGCDSKTVTRSNDMGDSKSKTTTNC